MIGRGMSQVNKPLPLGEEWKELGIWLSKEHVFAICDGSLLMFGKTRGCHGLKILSQSPKMK